MKRVLNLDDVPATKGPDPERDPVTMTKYLGALAGSERLYVNIDYVQPGDKSAKYHSHSLQEEFFLILKGSGSLRFQGEIIPVKAGDFLAKPAGKGLAHQFINSGTDVLEILDCGTVECGDIAEYPDEDIFLLRETSGSYPGESGSVAGHRRAAFRLSDALTGWSSDPNE